MFPKGFCIQCGIKIKSGILCEKHFVAEPVPSEVSPAKTTIDTLPDGQIAYANLQDFFRADSYLWIGLQCTVTEAPDKVHTVKVKKFCEGAFLEADSNAFVWAILNEDWPDDQSLKAILVYKTDYI